MQSAIDRFRQDAIVTASPAQLLTMLYDRLLLDLGRGEKALEKGDRQEAHRQLTHAQDIIAELMSSLKMDVWEGAQQLMALYVFAMKQLVNANVSGDPALVKEIHELFAPLCDAWHQAAAQLQAGDPTTATPRRIGGDLGVG
ncbi:MAG: flagellar export chaperone FliS [Actinomycetaceae bacterium]|nr:flagellar export chaperone FliS [Actinomycetaceae bacterium]